MARPTVMTPQIIEKLREWFSMSFTDDECCLYVGISRSTLQLYMNENPKFAEDREVLKRSPNMKAKQNLVSDINKQDCNTSKRRLERKARQEFHLKEPDNKIEVNLNFKDMTDEELAKMIK